MKNLYWIIIFALLFSACKKDDKTYTVSYRVTETIPGSAPFSVRYSLADGTFKSEGPLTSDPWITPDLAGYKKGAIVSFYLQSSSGSYDMSIYVNGQVSSHAPADGGTIEQLLEAQLPN